MPAITIMILSWKTPGFRLGLWDFFLMTVFNVCFSLEKRGNKTTEVRYSREVFCFDRYRRDLLVWLVSCLGFYRAVSSMALAKTNAFYSGAAQSVQWKFWLANNYVRKPLEAQSVSSDDGSGEPSKQKQRRRATVRNSERGRNFRMQQTRKKFRARAQNCWMLV